MDNSLLETIEVQTGAKPSATVIWMHGLGADGHDFEPIVPELRLPSSLQVRFIFPHAPVRPVTINNGYEMRAWYDIEMQELERKPDERGIRASQAQVTALIEREKSRGMAADRIVLAGFSQGGAIALQVGLRHGEALGGIAALSTYLTLQESLEREAQAANRAIPIFMAHGTEDPVIPMSLAESSRKALEGRGLRVEWHAYPMPHSVCGEEVEALSAWLEQRFASRILLA